MPTALVTGTSSGIGFATARRLAADGFDVIAGMRNPASDADALVAAAGAGGGSIRVVELDVDSDRSVRTAFDGLPPLDALVNNAGIGLSGPVEELPIEDWKATFETNVFGVVRCVQAALPAMRARGSGCVVNVGTFGARFPITPIAAYVSSKAALATLSEVLALETQQFGVRVVLLEVGYTATALIAKARPLIRESPYFDVGRMGGMVLAHGFSQASETDLIARAVRDAIVDDGHPFRMAVGNQAAESIALRQSLSDADWLQLFATERAAFAERYRAVTGVDISPTSPP